MLAAIVAVLIAVESGGDPLAVGDQGRSIGVLQMTRVAVADYNRLTGRNWKWEAARDPKKARIMAETILLHYAGTPPAASASAEERRNYAETCARIWNGGPTRIGTDKYAEKFLREWDRRAASGKREAGSGKRDAGGAEREAASPEREAGSGKSGVGGGKSGVGSG